MDTILYVLFFALSVFIVFVTIAFAVLAVYLILIIKSVYYLFEIVKKEGEKITADIESLRATAKSGGVKFASLIMYALSFLKHNKKSKK